MTYRTSQQIASGFVTWWLQAALAQGPNFNWITQRCAGTMHLQANNIFGDNYALCNVDHLCDGPLGAVKELDHPGSQHNQPWTHMAPAVLSSTINNDTLTCLCTTYPSALWSNVLHLPSADNMLRCLLPQAMCLPA